MGAPIGSVRPDGYLETCINRQRYLVHRLVWLWHYGEFPQDHTDHINHQRGDNRIENLRAVTNQQNNFNQSKRSNPTSSAYRGVDWVPGRGSWRARFNIGQTSRHLGYYPDEGTAAMVWNEAAATAYGEHANLNTAE